MGVVSVSDKKKENLCTVLVWRKREESSILKSRKKIRDEIPGLEEFRRIRNGKLIVIPY